MGGSCPMTNCELRKKGKCDEIDDDDDDDDIYRGPIHLGPDPWPLQASLNVLAGYSE